MSFDFVNPNNGMGLQYRDTATPIPMQAIPNQQQQQFTTNQQQPPMTPQQAYKKMQELQTPEIVSTGGGIKFTTKEEKDLTVPITNGVTSDDVSNVATKKRKKKETELSIIKPDSSTTAVSGSVESSPTIYSYYGTTELLHNTLNEIDALNGELVREFEALKANRTMKNKYNAMIGLSENISTLISNKINIIKEINNTIGKSNDLDYKKAKDLRAETYNVNDDKYIADLYKSFVNNPAAVGSMNMIPNIPVMDTTAFGTSGIIRADITNDQLKGKNNVDLNYLNYVSNLPPEDNMMLMESNPDIKQCVVFDASNGNRFFQVMNMKTGQAVPNMPTMDPMFLEDVEINRQQGIATNRNLKETYPLIVINEDKIASQY